LVPFLLFALLWGIEPGIYIWEGVRGDAALERSAAASASAGFRGARFLLSPITRRTYGLSGTRPSNLREQFASDAIQAVLKHKELRTIAFTAYDFVSYPNQRYLNHEFLVANRQRIFDEYEELTEAIMVEFSGSNRIFILAHWEGDNQVYCGSSYKFFTDDAERVRCLAEKPEERLSALAEWLKIRQDAVAAGRERAKLAGASNVEVLHAVEFNTLYHFRGIPGGTLRPRDFRGVLDTVVPMVKPDLCSYSAWESKSSASRFSKDLKIIASACGSARVMIGELPYDPKIVASIRKQSIVAIFFWQWPGAMAAAGSLP
jgi:hypothetical protein